MDDKIRIMKIKLSLAFLTLVLNVLVAISQDIQLAGDNQLWSQLHTYNKHFVAYSSNSSSDRIIFYPSGFTGSLINDKSNTFNTILNETDLNKTKGFSRELLYNDPPTVIFTNPTKDTTLTPGATLTLTAAANATAGGAISKVAFYANGNFLAEITAGPYTLTVPDVPADVYKVDAIAYDNNGLSDTATINVVVSLPPTVSFISPSSDSTYSAGTNIHIQANASDLDGIKRVEFYNNGIKIADDSTSDPYYGYVLNNVAAGSHVFVAKAYDNNNLFASDTITFTVNIPGGSVAWQLGGNSGTTPGTHYIGTRDNAGLFLKTNNLDRVYISSDGIVGIGTSNPDSSYRLLVNGKIKAKGLRVQAFGWADFVFEPYYKLRSLPSLEQYIRTNRHLPDVPTTKEVKDKGIDIAEIQARLLQKIEELTLYIIEQNKKLEAQAKKLELLERELKSNK
jgi:hypothetical protein